MTPPNGESAAPPELETLLSLDDVEARARALLPEVVVNFIAGGAADELTVRWNRERFSDLRLRPRVLRDLAGLDAGTTLFGRRMPLPLLVAPSAGHRYTHPEGELATARGAARLGVTMVLSAGTHTPIEEVIAAGGQPVWFQLYVLKDRGLTQALVERVQAAGATALCVTVDSPLDGARYRQQRLPLALPPGVTYPHLAGVREPSSIQTLERVVPANLTWKDIEWLRSITRVPLLLKGIMGPEDAELGIQAGADGLVVSNHGGRCLDTLPATIEVLPAVADAVGGRVPVLVDGGIRRGTDIVKALALGAKAVLVGRPAVYGLAVGGDAGVTHVLKLLRNELHMAMALLGCPNVASIDRKVLWP
jgi:4-hydroxymandelate oxidase